MNINRRVLSLLGLIIVTAVTVGGWWLGKSRDATPPERRQAAGDPDEIACGPGSLTIALNRLGIPAQFPKIYAACDLTPAGASFAELQRVGELSPVDVDLTRLTWEQLRGHPGSCVLFVRGNHFVAADPRETPEEESDEDRIRIYDFQDAARWMTRKELESIWHGETLTLKKAGGGDPAVESRPEARIEWRTCWEDAGYKFAADREATCRFEFRNVGAAPLAVETVETSCGCTAPTLSQSVVQPNEWAACDIKINLYGKRGHFIEHVRLRTNDPAHEDVMLALSGGVYLDTITSADTVFLGELRSGGHEDATVIVHDPGPGSLRLQGVVCEIAYEESGAKNVECLTCNATVSRLQPDSPRLRTLAGGRHTVRPGDYVVDIHVEARPDADPGRVRGGLRIATNLPGHLASLRVAIDATIRSSLEVTPRALLFAYGAGGKTTATILLKRIHGGPVDLSEVKVTGDAPIRVERESSTEPGDGIRIRVACVDESIDTDLAEGRICCLMRNGESVDVPVIVRRSRSQQDNE